MPTFVSHSVVPMAVALGLGRERITPRLLAAGVVASTLPDLDVVGFHLGIPYASELGHRGMSHSLALALAVGLVAAALHRRLQTTGARAFAFVALAAASHGILDALTTGGLGVALLWPFTSARWFAPVQVIRVSPLGWRTLPGRGLAVLASELRWIWGPGALLAVALRAGLAVRTLRAGLARRDAPGAPSAPGRSS